MVAPGAMPSTVPDTVTARVVAGQSVRVSIPLDGIDLVLECSGKFLTREALQPFLDNGAKAVVVSAPIDDKEKPDRLAAEICRAIQKIYGVRRAETSSLVERD